MLAIKVLGALGGFLFSLLVARRFGDAALGRAELFVLAITVGATFFRIGREGAVVKLFGAWSSRQEADRIWDRFRRWSLPFIAMACLAATVGWFAPIGFRGVALDGWFGLGMGAWLLIGWAGEALRGTGRVGWYAVLQPGWWMLMAAILILLGAEGPRQVLAMTAVVLAVFGMLGTAFKFKRAAEGSTTSGDEPARKQDLSALNRLAGPIWLGSLLHLVISWADTALLATWMTEADVAHYRAAFRLAALLTFTQFAVNALGAPTFGALHAAGDTDGLRRTVHRIGWMNTAVALPGLLFLALFGGVMLGLWGPAFREASVVSSLTILAAGQCFNALCGPVMYLLNMTGEERAGLVILAISALGQLAAAFTLVPAWGLTGAAWSAAVGMFLWNGLGVLWIRRRHGFIMISLLNGWWRRS